METENKKPQNPSAFPSWDMTFDKDPNTNLFSAGTSPGMTLRDHFAGLAMQSLLMNDQMVDTMNVYVINWVSDNAYAMADAMLKQREL